MGACARLEAEAIAAPSQRPKHELIMKPGQQPFDLASGLEARRRDLMLNGDAQALAGVTSDDLLYVHPATTLPIILDVGTDNPNCLSDPLYVGWSHERVRGPEYDDLIEPFVKAVAKRWPHVRP